MGPFRLTASGQCLKIFGKSFINILNRLRLEFSGRSYTCGNIDCISSVRVSRLVLSAVDQEFEPGLDQTKDYEIDICCISAKHTALRSMNKDWLVRNQNNLSQWSNMSTHGLLFQ